MARLEQARIKRYAVYVKVLRDGKVTFSRRPYNIVEYFWGNDAAEQPYNRTYLEPTGGRPRSLAEDDERYDDVRIYSEPPLWDNYGFGGGAR